MKRMPSWIEEEHEDGNFYKIYTDGSCDNVKSKIGGSAYIILQDEVIVKRMSKGFTKTTNNRMEMLAIISAVKSLPEGSSALIYTDSKYAITAFNGNSHSANRDLIELFWRISRRLKHFDFIWVKGHSGNVMNEYVDNLAFAAYCEMAKKCGAEIPYQMRRTH